MNRKKQSSPLITALYCRLSLEDGRDNESMSISNQKAMLRTYAEQNGMFNYAFYVDDGYTGRNFDRPGFQRMINDIEAGKIGCVITKDLSRIDENINGCLKDRWNHYFKVVFHKTGSEEQNKRECADTCAFPIVYDNLANQCKDDQDPEYGVYQACFFILPDMGSQISGIFCG